MLIWILAILLFGIFGALGYFKGSIRMLVTLAGIFIGLLFAGVLGPAVKPLLPLMKLSHPIWLAVLPPVLAFLLIYLVFFALSFFVHYWLEKNYAHRSGEYYYRRWQVLNRRLGACLGVVEGAILLILLGVVVFVGGHATVQLTASGESPAALRWLNSARTDLQSSGLAKTIAYFEPGPDRYYEAANTAGLVYHNPALLDRLANYPPFLSLERKPEFQEIANDPDYQNMLQTQAGIVSIANHPKTRAVLDNPALLQTLEEIDINDLQHYLKTGESPKFDDQKILGRWHVDVGSVLRRARRRNPGMSSSDLLALKRLTTTVLAGIHFTATTENKVYVEFEPPEEKEEMESAAVAARAQQAAQSQSGNDQAYLDRYGIDDPNVRQQQSPPSQPQTPAKPQNDPFEEYKFSGQGTWEDNYGKYTIRLTEDSGEKHLLEAVMEKGRLVLKRQGIDLVFVEDY